MNKSKLFKQKLFRLHTALGITISIFMYISIFFGIFTIFLPFIQTWEKPSRHFEVIEDKKIDYEDMINKVLKDKNFPRNNILINLIGNMEDPAVRISHRFIKAVTFNPYTNEILKDETKEQSNMSTFINHLHYGLPLKSLGLIFFGLISVGAMVLIVTGVILIIVLKFKNKGKNQQAIFSKIHVKLLTWIFLPLFLITLSGGVMNIGLISAGPMSKILTKNKAQTIDEVVGSVLFEQNKAIKKTNNFSKMLSINMLLAKAKEINPNLNFKQIKLVNWYDDTARVEIIGYNPYKPFFNGGIFNKPMVVLSAKTGKLIQNKKVMDKNWSVFFAEAIFFLHFLFGIDIFSRIFISLLMVLSCIAVGFGVMLYLEKKAKQYDNKVTFYHGLGKFSLASMVGIIPATGFLFLSQWVLSFDLEDRVLWQQGMFYNVWLFTLFWSFYKINSYTAAKDFLNVGAFLFIGSVITHKIYIFIHKENIENLYSGIHGVDISLLSIGIILFYVAKKLPNNREEAKNFWPLTKKKNKERNNV